METIDDDVSGRSPVGGRVAAAADTPPINAGLQAGANGSGVIVANDRDRRPLAWLREQVDGAAIEAAVAQLAGQRRSCAPNVAKALGITIPSGLALTSADTVRTRIAALRLLIKRK